MYVFAIQRSTLFGPGTLGQSGPTRVSATRMYESDMINEIGGCARAYAKIASKQPRASALSACVYAQADLFVWSGGKRKFLPIWRGAIRTDVCSIWLNLEEVLRQARQQNVTMGGGLT